MEIKTVGVVGAGQMGGGIAQVCAMAGLNVVLCDVNAAQLTRAREVMVSSLARLQKKGIELDSEAIVSRLSASQDMAALAEVDVVVEAATERLETKLEILRQISGIVRPDAIIASNTSSISLTVLAAQVAHPERAIGMHFMNPVPVMQLVEIIRALQTSDETHAAIVALSEKLGKVPVTVKDAPGFVSNRVLMPMINEAIFCLHEGLATPEAIDTVMKLGMNHPIGPLALADLIGLDTCLSIMDVLYHEFRDSKYRACPLLVQMVAAGRLGRKVSCGFYAYE